MITRAFLFVFFSLSVQNFFITPAMANSSYSCFADWYRVIPNSLELKSNRQLEKLDVPLQNSDGVDYQTFETAFHSTSIQVDIAIRKIEDKDDYVEYQFRVRTLDDWNEMKRVQAHTSLILSKDQSLTGYKVFSHQVAQGLEGSIYRTQLIERLVRENTFDAVAYPNTRNDVYYFVKCDPPKGA